MPIGLCNFHFKSIVSAPSLELQLKLDFYSVQVESIDYQEYSKQSQTSLGDFSINIDPTKAFESVNAMELYCS